MTSSGDKEEEEEASKDMSIADILDVVISDADQKLMEVYVDYTHQNDGSHLDGGIKDDDVWQARWQKLIILPCKHYDAPSVMAKRSSRTTLCACLNAEVGWHL
jgi:hypothetical protein